MILGIDPGGSSVGIAIVSGGKVLFATAVGGDDTTLGNGLHFIRDQILYYAADAEPHPLRWAMEDASTTAMHILRRGLSNPSAVRRLCYSEALAREACAAAGLGEPIMVEPKAWKAAHGGGSARRPEEYQGWMHRLFPLIGFNMLAPDAAAAAGVALYAEGRT